MIHSMKDTLTKEFAGMMSLNLLETYHSPIAFLDTLENQKRADHLL